jgi:hypothetical protein
MAVAELVWYLEEDKLFVRLGRGGGPHAMDPSHGATTHMTNTCSEKGRTYGCHVVGRAGVKHLLTHRVWFVFLLVFELAH